MWSMIPQESTVCAELISCNWKKQCSGKCKLSKENLQCTSLCLCAEHCYGNPKEHLGVSC